MKKLLLLGSALCMVMAMTSCKSSESAYKKAYEKAQAAAQQGNGDLAGTTVVTPVQQTSPVAVTPVTPTTTTTTVTTTTPVVQTTPVVTTTPVTTTTAPTLVNGTGLKAFSVVVASPSLLSNAQYQQTALAQKGYAAQIVSAVVNGRTTYRVIASTHDTREQAEQSKATLQSTYPDAWLLIQK